jgi:PAS domain S-box-containing protein
MDRDVRVLHVDDEVGLLDLTTAFLEREHDRFEVVSETDVSAALERLENEPVDCVVSDYKMPDVDGLEFLARVREEYADLPFILFTGEGSEAVASDAITAGATDYLQKESGTEQYRLLANRIENAVESYRAAQELERYEALVETVGDPMYVLDEGGAVTTANRAMAEMLETEQEAVVGTHASEFLAEGDFERGTELIVDIIDDPDRDSATYEVTVKTTTGSSIDAEINVAPLYTEEGEYRATVGVVRDVTERKQRERRLLEREAELERYETIVETMGDGVYALDESGDFVDVNDTLVEMTGFDREEIVQGDPYMWHTEAEIGRFNDAIGRLLESGEEMATVEADIEMPDGSSLPIEVTLSLLRDQDGQFSGSVGVVRDVTERRERERELEQYETVVQTFPDEVYMLDPEGYFTWMVPPTGQERTQSGHRPEELVGEHVSTAMDEEDIETGNALIAELIESPDRIKASFEMDIVAKDGERIPQEDHIALLPRSEDGEFRGTVGVLRDISGRKRRERELERQNERLEEFARIASHDLRNPLNVATGTLELARDERDSEYLDTVSEQLRRMETIIEDTLQMARHGEPVSNPVTIDVASTAPTCWEAVATEDAELVVEDEVAVDADQDRFKRVLENLFRNAIEHGGDDVTVRVGRTDGGEIYVEDDGEGISEDVEEELFQPGFTTAEDGTGFGLAIVEEIVEAHGWDIDVADARPDGARFEISGVQLR